MSFLDGKPTNVLDTNYALQGALRGMTSGPVGVGVGALLGALQNRFYQGRQDNLDNNENAISQNVGEDMNEGTNWGLNPDSPLAQFSDPSYGDSGDPNDMGPPTEQMGPPSSLAGGQASGSIAAPSSGWSGWGGGTDGAMLANLGMTGGVSSYGGTGGDPSMGGRSELDGTQDNGLAGVIKRYVAR